ncbi:MAG: hypothetical protein AAF662_01510 [Pseudomonadota bacterium]
MIIFRHRFARLAVFVSAWFVFWYVSSEAYFHFIHAVGSGYWALGGFGIFFLAPAFYVTDLVLSRKGKLQKKYGTFMLISILVSWLLYFPVMAAGVLLASSVF